MNKLFDILLPAGIDRDSIIKSLMGNKAIHTWFCVLPSSLFVRFNFNAEQLQEVILKVFPTEVIMVINITTHTDFCGLVPDNQVAFFENID